MRLRRFVLERYGCFERAALDFAIEPGRVNLVVAPNGAGKSVLRHAFHDLLFDIPLQSPMSFRFGYRGMSLQAEAALEDGTVFGFGWTRQGRGERTTTDPQAFARLRAATTPGQLEQLFALDTARLRRGGTDLKGGETLAGALLSGTGELARPRRVGAELEARRNANWGPGRSRPRLNAALSALAESRRALRAAQLRPPQRDRQQAELEQERDRLARARDAQRSIRAEIARLNRIARVRPALAALAEAQAWLAANPDVPVLPAGLADDLASVRVRLTETRARLAAAEEALQAARDARASVVTDPSAMACAQALADLPNRVGEAERAAAETVELRDSLSSVRRRIGRVLAELDAACAPGNAASLLPPVALLAETRRAIRQHEGLRAAGGGAAQAVASAAARLRELDAAPEPVRAVPDGLASLLDEIRADRAPDRHRAELDDALHAAEAKLASALARVPGWGAGASALRACAVPNLAAFEREAAGRDAARAACNDADAVLERRRGERAEAGRTLDALRSTPLPDASAIADAREARDRTWRSIRAAARPWRTPDDGPSASPLSADLAALYEHRVGEADALADRRFEEMDRVREAERLTVELARLETGCRAAAEALSLARQAADDASHGWAALVAPLGLGPDTTLPELRRFCLARDALIETLEHADLARTRRDHLAATHAAWADRLARLLEATPPVPLAALLALADQRIDAAELARQAGLAREAARREASTAHHEAVRRRDEADAALAAWNAAWASLLSRLGRPAGESPEAVTAVLERFVELDQLDRAANEQTERIDARAQVLDRFADGVAGLARALGEGAVEDPLAAASHLSARWDRARTGHDRDDQAGQAIAQRETRRDEALAAWQAACLSRDGLIAAAGAGDLDHAERRIAMAREHAAAVRRRDAATEALHREAPGEPRAGLAEAAASMPADALADALERAGLDAESADAAVLAASGALAPLEAAFDAGAEADPLLDATAAFEAASTEYARALDEQLVLMLAGSLLGGAMQAIESESESGAGGISGLASMFGAVTGGAYGIELDERDGATLHAIERRYPNERKTLSELSEGTRDQLYLALRMIALREHARGAISLPFIADDILQTFDDGRALASLRALADLSRDVQVIVLTHHDHLARIASALGEGVHCQFLT